MERFQILYLKKEKEAVAVVVVDITSGGLHCEDTRFICVNIYLYSIKMHIRPKLFSGTEKGKPRTSVKFLLLSYTLL